jgi:hypothetical protein
LSSAEDADIGIYDDMDSILDLIPKRLTYPVLVEICTYGKISSFELADIVTEGDGQLEIVNRQFSYSPGAKLMMGSSVQGEGTYENVSFTTSAGNDDDVNSSKSYWNAYDASSHRFERNIFDETLWDTTGSRGFQSISNNSASALKTYTCFAEGIKIGGAGCKGVSGHPYDVNNDSTIPSHDVSPSSLSNLNARGTRLGGERDDYVVGTTRMTNVLYGNHFTNINVRGCLGKITLRNLCVDGANYLYGDDVVHIGEYGFNISNSNIVLEHCAAMRCKRAGVFVKNSDVSIASGMTCYRNYEKEGGFVRSFLGNDEYGIGLHAVNSDINFATINEDAAAFTNAVQPNERGNPYNFAKNDVGIFLESSKLHGGTLWNGVNSPLRTRGTGLDLVTSFIRTFGNDVGLKMESSNITYLGILESFLNNTGIEANNSVLKLTQFDIQDNAIVGFNLDNSKLEYGYKGDLLSGDANGHYSNSIKEYKRSYTCSRNGQNLIIKNSSQVVPSNVGDLTTNLGSWGGPGTDIRHNNDSLTLGLLGDYMHSVGATSRLADMVSTDSCDLPAIVVKNGSFAEFVGLACAARTDGAPIKGACVAVTDNSKVAFRGTKHSWTTLTCVPQDNFGQGELLRNWSTAGVLANNNSVVEFTGPTKISRFGVPVLAENGSTVKFGPPTIDGQETTMDLNRFPVSSLPDGANDVNHTKVELHSTRACLVANNNSNIIIKHIGGWANDDFQAWTTDTTMRSTNPDEADLSLSACTSAGYFRFFPNGFTSGNVTRECVKLALNPANQLRESSLVANYTEGTGGLGDWNCTNFTDGGMCVRAVGNSNVDVNGVNFTFEYSPSSTSGVFYDFQGTHRARKAAGNAIGTDPYSVNNENYWPDPDGALTGPVRSHYLPDTSSFEASGGLATNLYTKTDIDTYSTSGYLPMPAVSGSFSTALHVISYGSYASNLMMWNIADTSRLHVANVKMSKGDGATTTNKLDPSAACEAFSLHGPRGKWANGVALDYFGEGGLATGFSPRLRTANTLRQFENYGMFRLLLGHRGDLKSLVEVSGGNGGIQKMASPNAIGGGAAIDQINAAGYQAYTSQALPLSGSDERLVMGLEGGADWSLSGGSMQFSGMEDVFGQGWAASAINEPGGIQNGINWYVDTSGNRRGAVPNMSIPPLHMDWQGYMRNWLDESASNLFTNAKHAASKKVNSLSIYRSTTEGRRGGEGRDSNEWNASFGVGCRSLNLFDLDRLL